MKNLNLGGMEQDAQFEAAAKYAGVPVDVMRGIWNAESNKGDPKFMVSPKGARGHFQIMPEINAKLSERAGRALDPMDFTDGLTMAAEVMRENMANWKGDVVKSLKGYNGGWDESNWNNSETNAYVGKVLGQDGRIAAFNTRNPGKASLNIEDVWNTSAYELRNGVAADTSGRVPAKREAKIVKGLRDQAATEAAAAALVSGEDVQGAALEQRQYQHPEDRIEALHEQTAARPAMTFDNTISWNQNAERERQAAERQAIVDGRGFRDRLGASLDQNNLTIALMKGQETPTFTKDKNYKPLGDVAGIMAFAQSDDEVDQQIEAVSADHLASIRERIKMDRYSQQQYEGTGATSQLFYGILGGVLDPAGFAAGYGVGKAFHLAGIGSRVLMQGGRTGAAFAAAGAEGVIGNVAVTAAMDAAGTHTTLADYGMAAGTGLLLGAGFNAFDWSPSAKATRTHMQTLGNQLKAEAINENGLLYTEALANLGPSATPDQIKVEVDRLESIRQERVMTAILGNAREEEMVLPRIAPEDAAAFRAQFTGNATVVPQNIPGAILTDPVERAALIKKYSLDLTVEDNAERLLAAEQYARAERFLSANPVNKEDAKTLLAAAGMESTAARMLSSNNPLMQFAASVLLESAQGAQGGARRVTAAITMKSKERLYMGNSLREYEALAAQHRASRGGNAISDWVGNGKYRKEFDDLVYAERDRRFNGHPESQDPVLKRAGDLLDEVYERMRIDQKHAGTLGAARLSETAVRGFSHRQWKSGVLRSLDSGAFRAFQGEAARQFELLSGYDNRFATMFSREYANIARRRASQSYDIPAGIHDDANADMVRNALKAMGAKDMEIEDVMGKFARGGASHTKQRIDLDLTTEYRDAAGNAYRLMDYIDTDNMGLLRGYSRRVAGEVSLAKFGVMGEPGMKELRTAIEAGMDGSQASIKELEAFDQIAAEFLGKPPSWAMHLGKWADNARILTSSIRLGGMGITQLGEYTNAIAALGVNAVFKNVTGIPRLFKEVRSRANGAKPGGLLESIELYTGELGMDGYKMQGMYDVNDGFEVYGKESLDRVSKAIRAGNYGVRVLSLHRDMQAVQVRGMSEQIVLKALRYIKSGAEDAALDDMGIGPELRATLKGEMSNIAQFKGDRVVSLDLTKATDQVAANEFAQAVARGASQIIQETFIGETGKWAHNDMLKLLTQFRTFSLTSVEKQWGRQVSVHGTARMIGYTLGAASIALPIHFARVQAKAAAMEDSKRQEYLDRNLHPVAMGRAIMNYMSATGLLGDVMDVPMALAGYEPGGARGANKQGGFLGNSIAPSIGVINDAVQAAVSQDPRAAAKLLPGASIPHFAWAMNLLDEPLTDGRNAIREAKKEAFE